MRSTPVPLPVGRITVGCCISGSLTNFDLFLVRVLDFGDALEPDDPAYSGSTCVAPLLGSYRDIVTMAAEPENSKEFTSFVGLAGIPPPLLEVRGLVRSPEAAGAHGRGLCGSQGDSPAWHAPAPDEARKDSDGAFSDWNRAGHAYVLFITSEGVFE